MIKYNLHTHSFYCGHGSGEIHEYFDCARKEGFSILGFSEHCPFPDGTYGTTRMAFDKMCSYESDVNGLKGDEETSVILGYECDYLPEWNGYFEDLKERVDYLVSGTHFMLRENGDRISPFSLSFSRKDIPIYAKLYIKAMETGLFDFMAHPDVFLLNYKWDEDAKAASRDIIEAAVDLDMPLEINSNGIVKAEESGMDEYGYPNANFWSLAREYGVKAVVSSDAHKVENLYKNYDKVYQLALDLNIELLEPFFDCGKLAFKTVHVR